MFLQAPEEVWRWYLYRFGVCGAAQPNEGHRALVELAHSRLQREFHDAQTIATTKIAKPMITMRL